jgi:hypothetical protein
MLQQHIHVACLTEGKASYKDLQAALKRIGMSAHFRAEGKNGTVTWLVQAPVADKIVGRLEYEGGRIAGLVLAGSCHQRTVVLGVYGYAGSSTEMQSTLLLFWKASLSIELPLTAHDPVHPQVSSRRQPLIIRVIMVR